MTVQIITDSGSDLTPQQAVNLGVTVVPLQVLIGGVNYLDGVDLTPEQFYERLREARTLPKTSQPVLHDVTKAYEEAMRRGPVLGVHLSSGMSGTYETAVMAARSISDSIHVWDSRTGSGGQALLVMEAAQMARDGADIPTILGRLEARRAAHRTIGVLNTLENAVKGGRVNPLVGMAASLLGVKPIVQVTAEGKVDTVDRVRGRAKSLERLLDLAAKARTVWEGQRVAVTHGACPADAEAFASMVRERFHPGEIVQMPIGATIGTYGAEGAILFSF